MVFPKRLALVLALLFTLAAPGWARGRRSSSSYSSSYSSGRVSVRGYTRKDGTYVRPHTRSLSGGSYGSYSGSTYSGGYSGSTGTGKAAPRAAPGKAPPPVPVTFGPDKVLSGVKRPGVNLTGRNLSNSILFKADLHGANLDDANLNGVSMDEADLEGARMNRVRAYEARMPLVDLSGVIADRALFMEANLKEAWFHKAKLTGANFRGANLQGTEFHGADLRGADFTDADLLAVELKGAIYSVDTIWPMNFDPGRFGAKLVEGTAPAPNSKAAAPPKESATQVEARVLMGKITTSLNQRDHDEAEALTRRLLEVIGEARAEAAAALKAAPTQAPVGRDRDR